MIFTVQLVDQRPPDIQWWWPALQQVVYVPHMGRTGVVTQRQFKQQRVKLVMDGGIFWVFIGDVEKPPIVGESVMCDGFSTMIVEVNHKERNVKVTNSQWGAAWLGFTDFRRRCQ